MPLRDEIETSRRRWHSLTLYEKFEHAVVLSLVVLIAVIIVSAVWSLAVNVLLGVVISNADATDPGVFQAVFGMIFTVIIALEFKRSLLIATERAEPVVKARAVVLIAILAVVRKLIILDFAAADALELFALAAATLSLGTVYWLVRDQDRREQP